MRLYHVFLAGMVIITCTCSSVSPQKDNLESLIESGKDVYFKDVTFNQDIDFTKFSKNLISEGVYQVRIVSSVTFENCIFKGKVLAYSRDKENMVTLTSFQSNLSFIGCAFHDTTSFRASSILGRTDFTNTLFLKTVSFEECTFFQNAYFRASAFHEELRFQNAVFLQKANFLNAAFDVTASFQQASFHGEAQFSSTKFMGYADFSLITCQGNFFANYAAFNNRADFNNGFYSRQTDITSATFKSCEMNNCHFIGEVRFLKSTAEERFSLDNSYFLSGIPDLSSFGQDKVSLEGVNKNK